MDLIIQTTPAVIDTNYDQIKGQVAAEVAKYGDVVVTGDTLPDAKRMATHLNKLKGEIAKRRKECVSAVSAPIKDFESKVKDLETMCEDGRQKILGQVATFEAETLKRARAELDTYVTEWYEERGIQPEFRAVVVDDLVKLGALTTTGRLAKGTKDALNGRLGACQIKQQRTALRLSQLENESHRAGLHSPLTREHVAGILLNDSDEQYAASLAQLIARELDRQKETLEKAEAARVAAEPVETDMLETPAPYEFDTVQPVDDVLSQPEAPESDPKGDRLEKIMLGRFLSAFHEWGHLIESETVLEIGFRVKENRLIFNQIVALSKAGDPVDVITVADKLDSKGELQGVGGLAYLAELAEHWAVGPVAAPEPKADPAPKVATGTTRTVRISVELEVEAPAVASLVTVESALRKKLVLAGIEKSIRSIFATEVEQQGRHSGF